MPFTDEELTRHLRVLEDHFWSHRRPPPHLRDRIREGQRIEDRTIELFYERPGYLRPGIWVEESIAKLTHVRSKDVWRLFWKRGDGKWHRYPPCPEAGTLAAALDIIHEDAHACFFG